MKERRTKEGYKLRVYVDAIREAKAITDQEWIENWSKQIGDQVYMPRMDWIYYLEQCAILEATKLIERDAA